MVRLVKSNAKAIFDIADYYGETVIVAGGRDNTISIYGGDDLVFAGKGHDKIDDRDPSDPAGSLVVYGQAGNDDVYSWTSKFVDFYGGRGNDFMWITTDKTEAAFHGGKGIDFLHLEVRANGEKLVHSDLEVIDHGGGHVEYIIEKLDFKVDTYHVEYVEFFRDGDGIW
jgi:hypothetical protein